MFRLYCNFQLKRVRRYDSSFSILLNIIPLENDYNDFGNLAKSSLSTEQAIAKLRMDNVFLTGAENYVCLQTLWQNEYMLSFADFLKRYNKKTVVSTLEAR